MNLFTALTNYFYLFTSKHVRKYYRLLKSAGYHITNINISNTGFTTNFAGGKNIYLFQKNRKRTGFTVNFAGDKNDMHIVLSYMKASPEYIDTVMVFNIDNLEVFKIQFYNCTEIAGYYRINNQKYICDFITAAKNYVHAKSLAKRYEVACMLDKI